MITILLGIVSSLAAEIVTAINKKLQGTVLQGDAAFLLAFTAALVGSVVRESMMPGFTIDMLLNWQNLTVYFSEIFATSQIYFYFVVQKFGLDVQPGNTRTITTTTVVPVVPVSSDTSTTGSI